MVAAWVCRNCRQVVSLCRVSAGGIFIVLRTRRIVEALTRWPGLGARPGSAGSPSEGNVELNISPNGDTAGSTGNWLAWECRWRRRRCGRFWRMPESAQRRDGPVLPGHSSCVPRRRFGGMGLRTHPAIHRTIPPLVARARGRLSFCLVHLSITCQAELRFRAGHTSAADPGVEARGTQRRPGVSGRQPGDAASAPPAAPSARIPPSCQPAGPWRRAAPCQKPCPWRGRVRW